MWRLILVALMLVGAVGFSASTKAEPTIGTEFALVPFDQARSLNISRTVPRTVVSLGQAKSPTRLVVEVVQKAMQPNDAFLYLFDQNANRLFGKIDLSTRPNGSVFSTPEFEGNSIVAELRSRSPTEAQISLLGEVRSNFKKIIPMGPGFGMLKAAGLIGQEWLKTVAPAIVRLSVAKGWCTGYVFERPDLIVTAKHCIKASSDFLRTSVGRTVGECKDIGIRFGYFEDDRRSPIIASCKSAYILEKQDVGLLKVKYNEDRKPRHILRAASKPPIHGDDLFAPSHPNGLPLHVGVCLWSAPDNHPTSPERPRCRDNVDTYDYRYTCGTNRGSSGAPIIHRKTGAVIATHGMSEWPRFYHYETASDRLREGRDDQNCGEAIHHTQTLISDHKLLD